MTVALRILLIFMSICFYVYVGLKLKNAEIDLMDTVFWIFLATMFIILSFFPQIALAGANSLGIVSPVNFIFLIVLCLLLFRNFLFTVRVAKLEEKVNHLIQEIAIKDNMDSKKECKSKNV